MDFSGKEDIKDKWHCDTFSTLKSDWLKNILKNYITLYFDLDMLLFRYVEDPDEKRERLVRYFSKNIHNKWVCQWQQKVTVPIIHTHIYADIFKYNKSNSITNLRYNIYFNGFIFCEFLNFAIVLLQFLVTNQFLSRRFLLYGLEVIRV